MEENKEIKKVYHAPQLSEFGDLKAITQDGGSGNGDIANSYSFS